MDLLRQFPFWVFILPLDRLDKGKQLHEKRHKSSLQEFVGIYPKHKHKIYTSSFLKICDNRDNDKKC